MHDIFVTIFFRENFQEKASWIKPQQNLKNCNSNLPIELIACQKTQALILWQIGSCKSGVSSLDFLCQLASAVLYSPAMGLVASSGTDHWVFSFLTLKFSVLSVSARCKDDMVTNAKRCITFSHRSQRPSCMLIHLPINTDMLSQAQHWHLLSLVQKGLHRPWYKKIKMNLRACKRVAVLFFLSFTKQTWTHFFIFFKRHSIDRFLSNFTKKPVMLMSFLFLDWTLLIIPFLTLGTTVLCK